MKKVGTVDLRILDEMKSLINAASTGTVSNDDPLTPVNCASKDAGIYIYRAYIYDNNDKNYTPVYLYTMGDFKEINLSQEGIMLHKWLEEIFTKNDYFASCNPSPHICRP